jgi:hypothetical protein
MSRKDETLAMGCMTMLMMFFVFTPALIVARAWVVSTIWNWYLPTGLGVPEMSMLTAFGVSVFVSMFTTTPSTKDLKEDATGAEAAWYLFKMYFKIAVKLAAYLFMAWLGLWVAS